MRRPLQTVADAASALRRRLAALRRRADRLSERADRAALLDRLDTRIVLLFLGLLLVVQLASFAFIDQSIEANARRSVVAELGSAERVFQRLLVQQADRLTESARVLATDFGFRDALASGDEETIADALNNKARRIGAELVLFADNQFAPRATSGPKAAALAPLVERFANAPAAASTPTLVSDATHVVALEGRTSLIVVVPVRAPRPIGWIAMSFPVGRSTLQDLQRLTSVLGTVVVRDPGSPLPRVDQTVQPAIGSPTLLAAIATGEQIFEASIGGDRHLVGQLTLADGKDGAAALVLTRSIDEAVAPFRRLKRSLLALTLIGGALFGIGSWVMARRVTQPIKDLSQSAERLGAGDYDTPIAVLGSDEVGSLSRAFEAMRLGIRERERRITRLAFTDELTGLPNRARFIDLLGERIGRDGAQAQSAILMLDLDRFKQVNEVLGQPAGDRLLTRVAERLRNEGLREGDLLARFGGDEFVLWLPGADEAAALAVAAAIAETLTRPLLLEDQTVDLGAGIGIALHPQHAADALALVAAAEVAMYEAKRRQSGVAVYQPGFDSTSQHSLSMLSEVREAITHDQLELYLQPKVALADGSLVGAEALVRWRHPQRGMIPPVQFVPFLEQTGSISLLTAWVLRRAALASRELAVAGLPVRIAVNLSARDLIDADFPAKVERLLGQTGIGPQALCLEITESATMDDPERALATLEKLARLGLPLSIDDFGTGYSSLSYLKRMPVTQLKIDRSFVMNMESDKADAQIVRSTIDLAHNLGLKVVAEGLETRSAWDLLRALDCDEAQGYLIARPMPIADFVAWARDWKGSAGASLADRAAATVRPRDAQRPAAAAVPADRH